MTIKAKRTRNPRLTRAKILDVAFLQILSKGFQSVSVDEIVQETGLTKGAFFHHFPTKQALGYALVDETLKQMTFDRWIKPLDAYENPLQGIIEVFRTTIDSTPDEHISLGCPLNNLVQEMSTVDPVFGQKLAAVMEFWITGIEKHLKRARQNSLLKRGTKIRQLAEFIVMTHEGAFGMTKCLRDKKMFRSLQSTLETYLGTLSDY